MLNEDLLRDSRTRLHSSKVSQFTLPNFNEPKSNVNSIYPEPYSMGPRPDSAGHGGGTTGLPSMGAHNAINSGSPATSDADRLLGAIAFIYENADLARKPHRIVSEEAWARYNNEWDFQDKEDWQSQRALPKVTMAVERLAATFHRIISTTKDWFTTKTERPTLGKWINVCKDIVSSSLNQENLTFFQLFSRCLKVGLLSQVIPVLITWEMDGSSNPETEAQGMPGGRDPMEDMLPMGIMGNGSGEDVTNPDNKARVGFAQQRGRLRLELLNPDKVLLDPTGRNRFKMVERYYTKGEFLSESKSRAFINVDNVMMDNFAPVVQASRDARKRMQPSTLSRDNVYLLEFWGDLYNSEGKLLFKNCYTIIANKRWVVLPPIPNPFWHKQIPILTTGLIDVPFSVYHKSLIGISLDSYDLWVDFLNMVIDYFQLLFLGVKEIDMSNLHPDEEGDVSMVYPGAVLKKRGPGELLKNAQFNVPDAQVWQFLSTLKNELNEGSAMSDAMEGTPRTRGKMSAMETTRRMAEGGSLVDFMFGQLEEGFIRPLLLMSFRVILQYMPMEEFLYWIESRQDKYPDIAPDLEAMKKMTPRQRYDLLANDMNFQTRVFSAIFDRQQEIEKITYAVGILGKIPEAVQHIKWANILGKLIEAFGWAKEEMISETPIKPFSEQPPRGEMMDKAAAQGSDGGESIPSEPPPHGSEGQASQSLLGSSGSAAPGMANLLPGERQAGNPKNVPLRDHK